MEPRRNEIDDMIVHEKTQAALERRTAPPQRTPPEAVEMIHRHLWGDGQRPDCWESCRCGACAEGRAAG